MCIAVLALLFTPSIANAQFNGTIEDQVWTVGEDITPVTLPRWPGDLIVYIFQRSGEAGRICLSPSTGTFNGLTVNCANTIRTISGVPTAAMTATDYEWENGVAAAGTPGAVIEFTITVNASMPAVVDPDPGGGDPGNGMTGGGTPDPGDEMTGDGDNQNQDGGNQDQGSGNPNQVVGVTPAADDRSDERDRIKDTAAAISVAAIAAWTINYVVAGTALDGKIKSYALPLSDEHYAYGLQIKPSDNLDIGLSVIDKSYVENASSRDNFYNLKIEYRF